MTIKKTLYTGLMALFMCFSTSGQAVQDKPWTLEACIHYARENNLTIRTNRLDQIQNEINLKEARFSRLPNLSADGNGGKQFGRTINPNTNEFTSTDVIGGSMGLSSSVFLFNGGRIINSIKRGKINLKASGYKLEQSKNNVALTVATNFLNVLLNREQLENVRFQLRVTREQLERTKKLVKAGSLPLTNQLDLESQAASNEVRVVNAENTLNLSVLSLKQAMQMPAEENLEIEAPKIEADDVMMISQSPGEIYRIALKNQPDVKSADLSVESGELGIKVARAAFLPSISLRGSISSNFSNVARTGSNFQTIQTPIGRVQGTNQLVMSDPRQVPTVFKDTPFFSQINNNLGQSIGIGLNIPIFNRYANRAGFQRAQITRQRAEINALNVRNQLRQNIETAYNNALASFKSFEATQKRVKALEESFRVTNKRYNAGGANFTDYQVAGNNLFAARADLVRTKYQYIFRTKILDFYLGNPLTLK